MNEEYDQQAGEVVIRKRMLRRRARRRKSVYHSSAQKRRWVFAGIFAALLAMGFLGYRALHIAHFAIALNGVPLVGVATTRQGESIIDQLKRKYAADVPAVVIFTQGTLAVQGIKHPMKAADADEALRFLGHHLTVELDGSAIFIKHKPIIMLESKFAALEALADAQQIAMTRKPGLPTFRERVVIDHYRRMIGKDTLIPIMTPAQAAQELTHLPRPQYYTVARNDNFYVIGVRHGLTVQQIKKLNPTLDPAKLQPGDQVRLPDILAPLTIVMRTK